MTLNKCIAGLIKRVTLKIKWPLVWLLGNTPVVVNACPVRRDIYLNSPVAVRVWLTMVDRPLHGVTALLPVPTDVCMNGISLYNYTQINEMNDESYESGE